MANYHWVASSCNNVCVVGCGGILDAHFSAWKHNVNTELVACVDIKIERAKTKAERWGIPKVYTRSH